MLLFLMTAECMKKLKYLEMYPFMGKQWFAGMPKFTALLGFMEAQKLGFGDISDCTDAFWATHVGTENGTLTVYNGSKGLEVTRGCYHGTVEEFLELSEEVHSQGTHREYRLLLEVAVSRIEQNVGGYVEGYV